jgi:hypothetical protein
MQHVHFASPGFFSATRLEPTLLRQAMTGGTVEEGASEVQTDAHDPTRRLPLNPQEAAPRTPYFPFARLPSRRRLLGRIASSLTKPTRSALAPVRLAREGS